MSEPNFGPPNRNRIVINLDDATPATRPQPVQPLTGRAYDDNYARDPRNVAAYQTPVATPTRSRAKRVLGVFAVVLLVGALALGVGGFFYWRSFQTTPAYSLALLVDAAQRGDTATFNSLIDVDKVAQNFVPQVTEKLSARYGGVLTGPVKLIVDGLIPQFLPNVKTQIREQLNQKVQEIGIKSKDYPFPLVALGTRWRTNITENGDMAQARVALKDRLVDLTLQREGERWKVVGVKDDALAERIADQVAKKLPAPGTVPNVGGLLDQLPDDIKKRLPDLGTLRNQLPEDLRNQLPDPEAIKKQAEERIKKEIEARIRQNVPPALRDQLPTSGNSNATVKPTPKPSPKPIAPPTAPKPKPQNTVEP